MGALQNEYNQNHKAIQEKGIELANEVERIESALKLLKLELKNHVDLYGDVNTGEKIWTYKENTTWEFDSKGLRKIAENIALEGKNPWTYLSITPGNLKSLGWPESALAEIGKKKIKPRFSGTKAK